MASLFERHYEHVKLLDPGAGVGTLSLAVVRRLCDRSPRPSSIAVRAYELDRQLIPALEQTYANCSVVCSRAGVRFSAEIFNEDFIEAVSPLSRHELFSSPQLAFNAAILNPPYRKIQSGSAARRMLRSAGIETSNLYAGFLALSAKLLDKDGELVAITPRSFCNGPYFKPFREQFLEAMSLRRLHVFESRSAAFQQDDVLQENIIVHAVKSRAKPDSVIVSASSGKPGDNVAERMRSYTDVVSPRDPERFIHLVVDEIDEVVRRKIRRFTTPLAKLGLEVSTGRVVDFRSKEFLVHDAQSDAVPLIYPCHFNGGFVNWPKTNGRKPNAIRDTGQTQELLIPAAIYVLVKRFTSKEERRRIVACIYDPKRIPADRVGFENHLNYFHARGGGGLQMDLAKGLAAYLNSTLADVYFRQFNGHTQVNATDLRNLNYPSGSELESLGRKMKSVVLTQAELDALIEKELF